MTNLRTETGTNFDPEPYEGAGLRPISWGAIFAGVIITVVLQLLLTLLGAGIGAASVDPLQQTHPGRGLGVGAAIWFFISTMIAVYVGSRVAGHLSRSVARSSGMLHGVLTWATTTILSMVFLASTASGLMGGAASMLGSAGAMATRNGQNPAVQPSGQASGNANLAPTSRETDQQTVQSQTLNEQRAREAGDTAAKRTSQGTLWAFFVLLLSGIVGAFAGKAATSPVGWKRHTAGPGPQPAT